MMMLLKRLGAVCKRHGEVSTIHGVIHAAKGRNTFLKLFWATAFIIATGALFWQIAILLLEFLRFEKQTNIEITFGDKAFAVTVCSMNPYKKSASMKIGQFKDLITAMAAAKGAARKTGQVDAVRSKRDAGDFVAKGIVCSCISWNKCVKYVPGSSAGVNTDTIGRCTCLVENGVWNCQKCESDTGCDYIYPTTTIAPTTNPPPTLAPDNPYDFEEGSDEVAVQATAQINLQYIATELNSSAVELISIEISDLIRRCTFAERPCNLNTDFYTYQDLKFGRCFTFNFNDSEASQVKNPGPMNGLKLILMTNTSDYLDTTETAGVRILIHNPGEMSFPDSFGYNLPLGVATSFSLKTMRQLRLNPPYGRCEEGRDKGDFLFPGKYTVEGCIRTCLQKKSLEECGCADPRFPLSPLASYCRKESKEARLCLANLTTSISMSNCGCLPLCNETLFKVSISSSKWPYRNQRIPDCIGLSDADCKSLKETLLMAEVFFEQMSLRSFWEVPAFPFLQLLSHVGGQLALWSGISVISMMECCTFCLAVCPQKQGTTSTKPKKKKRKTRKTSINSEYSTTSSRKSVPNTLMSNLSVK